MSMSNQEIFADCRKNAIVGGVVGTVLAMGVEALSRNSSKGTIAAAGIFGALGAVSAVRQPIPLEAMIAADLSSSDIDSVKRFAFLRGAGTSFASGFSTSRIIASYKKLGTGETASTDNDVLELE